MGGPKRPRYHTLLYLTKLHNKIHSFTKHYSAQPHYALADITALYEYEFEYNKGPEGPVTLLHEPKPRSTPQCTTVPHVTGQGHTGHGDVSLNKRWFAITSQDNCAPLPSAHALLLGPSPPANDLDKAPEGADTVVNTKMQDKTAPYPTPANTTAKSMIIYDK